MIDSGETGDFNQREGRVTKKGIVEETQT